MFTGFGVMWAMLILVVLQGASAGLYNGTIKKFHRYSNCTLSIRPGYSSADGMHLTEALTSDLADNLNNVFEQIMPIFRTKRSVACAQAMHETSILGVGVGYEKINHLALTEGRFFTERDITQRLPVCILSLKIKTTLFDTKAAVGQFVTIDSTVLYVIGVLEAIAGVDNDQIIIPSSLFKGLFPLNVESIDCIMCALMPKQNPVQVEEKIRAYLAGRLNFEAQDKQVLHINNLFKRARSFQMLFIAIQGFIWLVSLCFLVSGVVGVSNMMHVVVKERTQELAIRKVIGAKSSDIIGLILLESIVINLIAGILGLGTGMSMLQWINRYLVPILEKHGIARFEFQFSMVLFALGALVLSGCLAGMIPAKRASYIKPVDALNNE